ncbi:TetR/AcrR family transcriptional regulator [Pseudomonas benzenivorans]|uniref:TetR/AcrR family transcriptional regulator n=1 Tax=Pseudomonas benzenivorans TaxID=556533 RepID=A0ABY5HA71_9PSED|nr:TetR/AcrR family transcriptional regulator [Pseudomonas benzenivorans]UTW08879.1 TetR/AcrR family transcriptional regulator [Pseudomonas benzenivorans]
MESNQSEVKPSQALTPKGQRTRKNILDAARRVFSSSGYVGMRMTDVASEAGLSLGALYRYFEQKDDLFLSVVEDIHEELYAVTRAGYTGSFKKEPYETLYRSNLGYMRHYYENREVMRAFIEATMVDTRYRDMWWYMRERHIKPVVAALYRDHGISEIRGVSATKVVEALASTTEQSAFVWFSQAQLCSDITDVTTAAKVITDIWYFALFESVDRV